LAVLQQNTAANGTLPCDPHVTATCQNFFFSNAAGQNNALLWGYTVGAGLDWALTPNIFARGEFEFVQFAPWPAVASAPASSSKSG